MNRTRFFSTRSLFAISLLVAMAVLAACGRSDQSAAPGADPVKRGAAESTTLIAAALSAPDRFAGDSDEDEWRNSRAILQFFGVESGMHVVDYFAGSGYYSELLARCAGPSGLVIAYNNKPFADFAGEKLINRFANNRLAAVKVVTTPTNELKLDADSLDGVLFFWSYHDLYWQPKDEPAPLGDPAQVTAMLFKAVKPGGHVVVVDHIANPGGATAKVVDALHRIDPEVVKSDFTKAGFVFDGESVELRHPDDDHTKAVFDESVRHKTDQLLFKFRKPAK